MLFIIAGIQYSEHSGGIMALYRLAERIRQYTDSTGKPHQAAIVCGTHGNLTNLNEFFASSPVHIDKTVVVYPEIYKDNQFNAKNVVRWVLANAPYDVYGENDLVFQWDADYEVNPLYLPPNRDRVNGKLFIADFHRDIFFDRRLYASPPYPYNETPRSGTCYLIRKGANTPPIHHPADSLNIDDYFIDGIKQYKLPDGGNRYLADVFAEKELFICYDEFTQISTSSVMCGCPTVVIPRPAVLGRCTDRRIAELVNCGIAYGFDRLSEATENMRSGSADNYIGLIEQESDALVANFIRICQEKFQIEQ